MSAALALPLQGVDKARHEHVARHVGQRLGGSIAKRRLEIATMAILIDGYNLLHASGILGRGRGPGSLERSRQALLNFVAASLKEQERKRTVVVFDAKAAPPGLPRALDHRGLCVRFATGYENADALIVELIHQDSSPRQLTVVSSDHEIRRAARRRRAHAVPSDAWFRELLRRRKAASQGPLASAQAEKPAAPLTEDQVDYWVAVFAEARTEPSPRVSDVAKNSSVAADTLSGMPGASRDAARRNAADAGESHNGREEKPGCETRATESQPSGTTRASPGSECTDALHSKEEKLGGKSGDSADPDTVMDPQLLAEASALLADELELDRPFPDEYCRAIEKELLADDQNSEVPLEPGAPPARDAQSEQGASRKRRR